MKSSRAFLLSAAGAVAILALGAAALRFLPSSETPAVAPAGKIVATSPTLLPAPGRMTGVLKGLRGRVDPEQPAAGPRPEAASAAPGVAGAPPTGGETQDSAATAPETALEGSIAPVPPVKPAPQTAVVPASRPAPLPPPRPADLAERAPEPPTPIAETPAPAAAEPETAAAPPAGPIYADVPKPPQRPRDLAALTPAPTPVAEPPTAPPPSPLAVQSPPAPEAPPAPVYANVPRPPLRPADLEALTAASAPPAATPAATPPAQAAEAAPAAAAPATVAPPPSGGKRLRVARIEPDANVLRPAPEGAFPPAEDRPPARYGMGSKVFVRIFKQEGQLELWLESNGRYHLQKTFPICRWSGHLGPKMREADFQSPEGFYSVSAKQLHPHSNYHRAFNVGYPNAFDKQNGRTGGLVMVHGNCKSVGCFAMTDPGIEEIYGFVEAALRAGQREVPVHIFPFRMTDSAIARETGNGGWLAFASGDYGHHAGFWRNLKEGYDLFEQSGAPPTAWACGDHYAFDGAGRSCKRIAGW